MKPRLGAAAGRLQSMPLSHFSLDACICLFVCAHECIRVCACACFPLFSSRRGGMERSGLTMTAVVVVTVQLTMTMMMMHWPSGSALWLWPRPPPSPPLPSPPPPCVY